MSNSTRDLILRTLRTHGRCTIKDLAEAAGVSPVSVRHHLANLQAENLVEAEEVRHGVGRPRLVFSLSERANELFPGRYFRLTTRLLDEIKDSLPEGTVGELFAGVASAMAEDYATRLAGLPLQERLERLVEYLTGEGFAADIQTDGDRLLIRELSCPYFRIGRTHPEVCLVDQAFIATALSLPVERVTCLLDGHSHCTYAVAQPNGQPESPHE